MSKLYKQCSRCEQILPLNNFSPSTHTSDGYLYHCRPCHNQFQNESRKRNFLESIHKSIMERCYTSGNCPNKFTQRTWRNYGGRGIGVSEEFLDRDTFVEYISPLYYQAREAYGPDVKLIIDRIDNEGDYERGNLRFVTPKESTINRRVVKKYEFLGYNLPLAWWAKIYDIPVDALMRRLDNKWTFEQALKTPPDIRYDKRVEKPTIINDDIITQDRDQVFVNGQLTQLNSLCKQYNISHHTVRGRLGLGWDISRALKTKVK